MRSRGYARARRQKARWATLRSSVLAPRTAGSPKQTQTAAYGPSEGRRDASSQSGGRAGSSLLGCPRAELSIPQQPGQTLASRRTQNRKNVVTDERSGEGDETEGRPRSWLDKGVNRKPLTRKRKHGEGRTRSGRRTCIRTNDPRPGPNSHTHPLPRWGSH